MNSTVKGDDIFMWYTAIWSGTAMAGFPKSIF